ncbi:MAG: thiolase family protein [Novosphingobium sp.]
MSEPVAIAAAFELPPGRYPDQDCVGLFRQVLKGLIGQCPIRPQDIDGLLTCPSGGVAGFDPYVHEKLISELGIRPAMAEVMNLGGATFAAMVDRAAGAIRAGLASAVICIGAGKFMKPSAGGAELMARVTSDTVLEMPYGTFIPALYALIASQYMAERGASKADLARVAVAHRKWAVLNPNARMASAGEISVEDVLASRPISTPFNLLDCSVPCDGGGAIIVARGDLARKWTEQPAWVLGYGEHHSRGALSDRGNLLETGAAEAGARAFSSAGLTPDDIDVAQLYDAFSSSPLILLEELGFCAPGEAAGFVASGAIDPGGSLPVNTYGGLLSFGHTGDSSGMSMLTAGALQTMGLAGPTQVENANRVLVHTYGGIMFDHATLILGREP